MTNLWPEGPMCPSIAMNVAQMTSCHNVKSKKPHLPDNGLVYFALLCANLSHGQNPLKAMIAGTGYNVTETQDSSLLAHLLPLMPYHTVLSESPGPSPILPLPSSQLVSKTHPGNQRVQLPLESAHCLAAAVPCPPLHL